MKTVIEMAREAGIRDCTCNGTLGCLDHFADLVRADEREACAKVAEDMAAMVMALLNVTSQPSAIANAIRARSNT